MKKRILSMAMAFVMALSLLPATALADEEPAATDPDIVYGSYDNSGKWTQNASTGTVTTDLPKNVESISKTAKPVAGNANQYEVTLKVVTSTTTTTTTSDEAATVLVIDTSGSMNFCTADEHTHTDACYSSKEVKVQCTPEGNWRHWYWHRTGWFQGEYRHYDHTNCQKDSDGNYYYTVTTSGAPICGKEEHTHWNDNDNSSGCGTQEGATSRLAVAKQAAMDFLKSYSGLKNFDDNNGETTDTTPLNLNRYISIISFNKTGKIAQEWVDVSDPQNFNSAVNAISKLTAREGTNLDDGLRLAAEQLNADTIKDSTHKNAVVLTDGAPTYYSENPVKGHGYTGCPETNNATASSAAKLKEDGGNVYTVCFGAADETCWDAYTPAPGRPDDDAHWRSLHKDAGPTVGEYLCDSIATPAADGKTYAFNAADTAGLMNAFKAITTSITEGFAAGTVTDSLPDAVTTTDPNFAENWALNLKDANRDGPDSNGKTTYTFTKSYVVTVDPEKVADGVTYQPLNNETTLTVDNETKPFPIPAVKVTKEPVEEDKYTVTYQVTGDQPETFDGIIPDATEYAEYDTVTVAGALTTTSTTNGTQTGTWTFNGWTVPEGITLTDGKSFSMPAENVTITGTWTFTPVEEGKYTVTYQVTGDQPETFDGIIPDATEYAEYDTVTVAGALTTTSTTNGTQTGTWTFNGWTVPEGITLTDGKSFSMPAENVTITGTWTFKADEITPDWDWKGSTSKTAENLVKGTDGRYTSQVTLSIPSAEEPLTTDVVFVLDKSTSVDLEKDALDMLSSLRKQADTSAKINVGVVIFNQIANVAYEGKFFDLANQYDEIEAAIQQTIEHGSNTHAGLLAGKAMLDNDTSVPANRKYLIFVSDGVTYQFCHENDYQTAWTRSFSVEGLDQLNQCGTLSELNNQYGNEIVTKGVPMGNINTWLTDIDQRVGTEYDQPEKYDYEYTGQAPKNDQLLPADHKSLSNVEKALYLTKQTYETMQASGYHCYAVLAKNTYKWGTDFMNLLGGGKTVDFAKITSHILYAVDAGSYVKDYMGFVAGDYNFDFVNDASKLSITVGKGEPYKAVKIDANDDNHYGFGPKLDNGKYSYELTYTPGSKEADEYFVWKINVPVSNFAPVALTYTVELSNPKTAAGTYGKYDENGSKHYSGLYTNYSAMLYPVDSNGFPSGDPQEFPKPTVSYTVKGESAEKVSYTVVANYYTDGKKDNTSLVNLENGEADVGTTITVTPQSAWRTYDGNRYTLTTKNRTLAIVADSSKNVLTLRYDRTTSDDDGYDDDDGYLNTEDHFSYIIGYTDGMLRPYGNISRGEVATIFFRLLTDNAREKFWSQTNSYTDVAPEKWCNNAISTLSNMGIIDGYLDGTFRPDGSITRAEFSKMAVNFFDYTVKEYQGYFPDVPEDAWYARYVEAAREMKLIEGYIDGSFQPNKAITRAEACTIVNRTLGRLPDKDQMDVKGVITWPDCSRSDWYYEAMMEATNSHDYSWIYRKNVKSESWSKKLDQRDWAALERTWSTAHSAPGGEVAK